MADDQDSGTSANRLYGAQPTFTVEGTLKPSLQDGLLALEISDDVRGMKRLDARFENWGTPPGGGDPGFMFFDGGTITFGNKLEVNLGPSDASQTVFKGWVTAIGAEMGAASVPEFTICAEDQLQFFRLTRRTRTYENQTDAQVAQTLASAHNLGSDADAPGPTHKVLVQVAQTDLAFLRDRARAIDAQVWIENDQLKFKARSDRSGGELTLTLGDTLSRFRVLSDLAHQVVSVHAHGWDVSSKSDPDSTQQSSLLSQEARGGRTGGDILQQAFGARAEHVLDYAASTTDEASYLGKSLVKLRGRAFTRCRGETVGNALLKVGSSLKIDGVGPIFSGHYFATQVTHRYDRSGGFVTIFEAERPAVGQEN